MAEAGMPAGPVTESFDRQGFLEPSAVFAQPDIKIAFIGGSTTQVIHVPPAQKFPHLVGQILSERSGCKVNTYNAALSGNDSIHSINILVNKVLPLHPDYVVVMENINDLQKLIATGGYWNEPEIRGYLQPLNTVRFGLKALSARTIPYTLHVLSQASQGQEDEWDGVRGKHKLVDLETVGADQLAALTSIVQVTKAWGIRPVLIVPASRFKPGQSGVLAETMDSYERDYGLSADAFFRLHNSGNDRIRALAAESGALLVDLDAAIPAEPKFIYDWVHLSIEGSRRAAQVIADRILPTLALSQHCRFG
jgi:hypothetical protein